MKKRVYIMLAILAIALISTVYASDNRITFIIDQQEHHSTKDGDLFQGKVKIENIDETIVTDNAFLSFHLLAPNGMVIEREGARFPLYKIEDTYYSDYEFILQQYVDIGKNAELRISFDIVKEGEYWLSDKIKTNSEEITYTYSMAKDLRIIVLPIAILMIALSVYIINKLSKNKLFDAARELYNYREMLSNLVKKDLRTRYKGSTLGFLWTFINPLLQLVVYSIVFSTIMRVDVENYSLYLFIALIPWIFCATTIQVGAGSIIANKDLVKKIYFPRAIIPMSVATSGLMNMLFSMIVVLLAIIISGIGITINIIYLPLVIIAEFMFVLGITFIVSALNVYFRDLEHVLGIVIMLWFYATPIVYTIDMIPKRYMPLFNLNPMLPIIEAYRKILYHGQAPDIVGMTWIIVICSGVTIFGYMLFNKLQKNFVEGL